MSFKRIIAKEFGSFFTSPIAYIFLGVFLAASLFIFFWVERFFATNIAEIRALFTWMPILLIFLSAAVTMRMWAEERRSGTLEFLLTSPVRPLTLVLGKFCACLLLVILSLALTLPLPVTVSFLGSLDWGPVVGGYLASIFLAGAYIAIGLYSSVKSDNQIVSLIMTTIICTLFYVIGSDTLSVFFGNYVGEILQLLGSGSRFESITRGVIDLRDLYYYLSIIAIFLCLNVYGLEKVRWGDNPKTLHHRSWQVGCSLLVLNFLIANLWLAPVTGLRSDLTRNSIYSISEATKTYLQQLKEPLLIRGYFSPQTHPLLAPMVPRIKDLLAEYAIAGGAKVRVEFVDPQEHPALEQEAAQKYGIRPIPFQTASRYQTSVTSSYFDILIQYGDQFETLSFRDLIELKARGEADLEVELRNPEYDITRAIKKVLYSYQGGGDLFSNIDQAIEFTAYMSEDNRLPEELAELKQELRKQLKEIQETSEGLFTVRFVDPDAGNGEIASRISDEYGFRPMAASLFDDRTFWYYMTLSSGSQMEEVPLPDDFSSESMKRSLEGGLKRFGKGFAKTVALFTPPQTPQMPPQYGMMPQQRGPQFNFLRQLLSQEHVVTSEELSSGRLSETADILMVAAPENLDDKQLFAIDQFLMRGGTVILVASPYKIGLEQGLMLENVDTGLEQWLDSFGIKIENSMVLDPQNSAFPVPVQRNLGGFSIQEMKMVSYPHFVDVRKDGLNAESGMMGGVEQLTINWGSPISVDDDKNSSRSVTRLVESSDGSWVSDSTEVQPNFSSYPQYGFARGDSPGRQLLAVSVEGVFHSFFKDRESPMKGDKPEENDLTVQDGGNKTGEGSQKQVVFGSIDKSSESARIIIFSSSSFLRDTVLSIGSSVLQTTNLNSLHLMKNVVDWSLEDRGLLEIRGRSHFARPLYPISKDEQLFWEYLNYFLAFVGVTIVWFMHKRSTARRRRRYDILIRRVAESEGGE